MKYTMEEARERLGLIRFITFQEPEDIPTIQQFLLDRGIKEPIKDILAEAEQLERFVYGGDFEPLSE